jgi:hypothetical protein
VPALSFWRLTPSWSRALRGLPCRLLRYQHPGTWKSGVTWDGPIGERVETRGSPAKAGDCQLRRGRLQGRILVEPVQHDRMAKPRPGNWDTRAGGGFAGGGLEPRRFVDPGMTLARQPLLSSPPGSGDLGNWGSSRPLEASQRARGLRRGSAPRCRRRVATPCDWTDP